MLKKLATCCPPILTVILMSSMILFNSKPALSATIIKDKNNELQCEFFLKGEIQEGDADKLKLVVKAYFEELQNMGGFSLVERISKPVRICLDSPGGSFVEGVKLAKVIRANGFITLGTAIPDQAVCLSACSIAFMAGGHRHPEGEVTLTDRVMHPTAELGFHAPAIQIAQGQYNEKAVEKAYNIALQSVAAVAELRSEFTDFEFADSIFLIFLRTPASTFTYIETVGQATRFGIGIVPAPVFDGALDHIAANLCANAIKRFSDTEYSINIFQDPNLDKVLFTVSGNALLSQGAFYEEAIVPCKISDFTTPFRARFGVSFPGALSDFPANTSSFFASATHPPDTKIANVPVIPKKQPMQLTSLIERASRQSNRTACGLSDVQASVVNVSNFTNLRAKASINSNVIRRVPLSADVAISSPGVYWATQRCLDACQSDNQSTKTQCIENNEVWIEVNYNTQRGFLSRKFLD